MMAYQMRRKDLAHVRAFTTVSTKHTAASHNKKATIMRVSPMSRQNERDSSARSIRTLTFGSQQDQQLTDEDDDVLSVKAVPSNFVSMSKPSQAIERLMTKKRNAHESCLEDMRTELAAVHDECADDFRERSNCLKVEMDNIRRDIEEHQLRIQNTDLLKLTDDDLRTTWDSITLSITEERSCIEQFHERLGEIEHNRKLLVKAVMKKYREILHSISYTSPIDIKALLENEIQEYNKTVLTNFKVYEDLHLHMCIRTDDRSQELLNWLEAMKSKRRDAIRNENRKRLISKKESLERTDEVFLYDPEGLRALKGLSSALGTTEETIGMWRSELIIFAAESVSECSKQLTEVATELSASVSKLIESYKSALQAAFDKYRNEVDFLKVEDDDYIPDEDMQILDEAVHSLENFYQESEATFEDLYNRSLTEIQETIARICGFLNSFNSIRTNQSSRLVDLQEATGNFIDELTSKSQRVIAELEKKLDLYSQQLRQASNKEKIEQLLSQISSTSALIEEKCRSAHNEECKAVKRYIETVTHEVPKIIQQFDHFLDSYGTASVTSNVATDEPVFCHPDFVGKHSKMCQNLVSTIAHWEETLLSEIVAFRDNFPVEIQTAAETWEDTIVSRRLSVLQTKLDANSQRCEDIKNGAYDVRIREIEGHRKQLENHEAEVNETVNITSNRLDEFLGDLKHSLELYDHDISQSVEKLSEAKSTAALKRIQKEIERIRDECKATVEQNENNFREELKGILDSLMSRNDNFLNDLKLFKDGGSFSAEEIKTYKKSLTSCGKTIAKAKIAQTQKIDKATRESSQSIEKSYKTSLDRSNTAMREIKFHEDARKILGKCSSILERQAHHLLEDDTRFVNAVVDRVEESTRVSCENLNLTNFADQSISLLNFSDARLNYLMEAFPSANENSPNDQAKANRKISNGSKRKKQKSVSKVINYRTLFLGSGPTPISENYFATSAMSAMSKAIDDLQNAANNFFSPTSKRNETEAIYHDYMQEILHRMNCYRGQLQYLWRGEVQDVLTAAKALDRSISDCIRDNFEKGRKRNINEITALKEDKLRALSRMTKVCHTRRSELLDSLKMTHGNPGRRDSLDKLTEQVLLDEETMENTMSTELDEFKKELEGLVNSYETSLLEASDRLRDVTRKINERGERRRLKALLDRRSRSDSPEVREIPYRLDIAETMERRCPEYRQDSESTMDNSFDIESLLSELMEEAQSLGRSAMEEAETMAEEFVKTGEEFRKNWKSNIDTVVEVYAMLL